MFDALQNGWISWDADAPSDVFKHNSLLRQSVHIVQSHWVELCTNVYKNYTVQAFSSWNIDSDNTDDGFPQLPWDELIMEYH